MRIFSATIALALSGTAFSHEYLSFEELMKAFNTDFEAAEIRVREIGDGLYFMRGAGGNVVVSIGDQGVLMVDSQYEPMVPKLRNAISELGGDNIDFTINTHWHFDHVGGNPTLGRDGTWFVAHENSRRMMAGRHGIDLVSVAYEQQPSDTASMPVLTFDDDMQVHFNGETIDLMHFGPAHTTGDTAVYFRTSNAVHMGDVVNASYPFIDAGNGGDLDGMILFCEKVLARLNEESTVVPGHGPLLGYNEFVNYIAMLETTRNRISDMIDRGMTMEQVHEARPTAEFDEKFGDPARFVDRAYVSLSR
jgi:glyoxylase-like metal-dependent hydrolase (beta-lactamase superfamily II)